MKIKEKNTIKKNQFHKLSEGDVFITNNDLSNNTKHKYYMKTQEFTTSKKTFNSVQISTGELYSFEPDDIVYKLEEAYLMVK